MPTTTPVLSDLHHEVRGAGPPVLFISGASGDAGHLARSRARRRLHRRGLAGLCGALVRRIRHRARSLEELAERGPVVPVLDESTVRELVVGSYRLIYEIGETEVHVLGLIHGARDLSALWDQEARSGPGESEAGGRPRSSLPRGSGRELRSGGSRSRR